MSIRTVLVDDEPAANQIMQLLLQRHCPEVQVVANFTDPAQALRYLKKNPPQLLFLDIEMPRINGFDLLQKLNGYTGSVIFVTAYSQYAVRAFKFSALDYLLKPVDTDELQQAIQKHIKKSVPAPDAGHIAAVEKNLSYLSEPVAGKITIPFRDGFETLIIKDIEYLEAERSYTRIIRSNAKLLLISKPLKMFEEILNNNPRFLRIHKSYLINIGKVKRYNPEENTVVTYTGAKLPVSRRHRTEVAERLKGL